VVDYLSTLSGSLSLIKGFFQGRLLIIRRFSLLLGNTNPSRSLSEAERSGQALREEKFLALLGMTGRGLVTGDWWLVAGSLPFESLRATAQGDPAGGEIPRFTRNDEAK